MLTTLFGPVLVDVDEQRLFDEGGLATFPQVVALDDLVARRLDTAVTLHPVGTLGALAGRLLGGHRNVLSLLLRTVQRC